MEISTPVMTPAGTITSETTPGLTFVETTVTLKTPTSMETIFLGTTYPETTTISTVSSKTTTSAVGSIPLLLKQVHFCKHLHFYERWVENPKTVLK